MPDSDRPGTLPQSQRLRACPTQLACWTVRQSLVNTKDYLPNEDVYRLACGSQPQLVKPEEFGRYGYRLMAIQGEGNSKSKYSSVCRLLGLTNSRRAEDHTARLHASQPHTNQGISIKHSSPIIKPSSCLSLSLFLLLSSISLSVC